MKVFEFYVLDDDISFFFFCKSDSYSDDVSLCSFIKSLVRFYNV